MADYLKMANDRAANLYWSGAKDVIKLVKQGVNDGLSYEESLLCAEQAITITEKKDNGQNS